MPNTFKYFLNTLCKNRKIIFDLDETLWQCTIEYDINITLSRVQSHIKPATYDILRGFQNNGNSLNIASRSSEPEKCKFYIQKCFNDISFDNISIYPTPKFKTSHILDAYKNERTMLRQLDFIMFDDEAHILRNVKQVFPKSKQIQCNTSLDYSIILKNTKL